MSVPLDAVALSGMQCVEREQGEEGTVMVEVERAFSRVFLHLL